MGTIIGEDINIALLGPDHAVSLLLRFLSVILEQNAKGFVCCLELK